MTNQAEQALADLTALADVLERHDYPDDAETCREGVKALRAALDREAKLREAVMAVVEASRAYLPPDGISKDEFINRVIGATDNSRINPIILEG